MKLPRDVSGAEAVKALRRLGFVVRRQDGSHIRLSKGSIKLTVPKPNETQIVFGVDPQSTPAFVIRPRLGSELKRCHCPPAFAGCVFVTVALVAGVDSDGSIGRRC